MDQVLLIEDDRDIVEILEYYLTKDGEYGMTHAPSAEAALPLIRQRRFDAILLDIMLPGIDGIDFCQQIRKRIYCPIIFISCLDDDKTIINAMKMGGDDYLKKPFSCSVLKAYLEANIRRSRMQHAATEPLEAGGLRLDPATHRVHLEGHPLYLSPTEYEILYYMMRHPGVFMDFEDIYTSVWGCHSCGDLRTLFTHVANLRRKLSDDAKNPIYISTHPNGGYVFYSQNMP